ncbi:MAG TPA: glycosyltransferase, partial [Thermotogota bacterium]|nr:glycosyltransferase [Thermotogota bacterium]
CGKPVIATKCGGPESFINRENGILVEVGKPDQIANALEAMLRNTSSFNSQVIRESFLSRFSSEVVVQKIEALYRDIINRNPNECLP